MTIKEDGKIYIIADGKADNFIAVEEYEDGYCGITLGECDAKENAIGKNIDKYNDYDVRIGFNNIDSVQAFINQLELVKKHLLKSSETE